MDAQNNNRFAEGEPIKDLLLKSEGNPIAPEVARVREIVKRELRYPVKLFVLKACGKLLTWEWMSNHYARIQPREENGTVGIPLQISLLKSELQTVRYHKDRARRGCYAIIDHYFLEDFDASMNSFPGNFINQIEFCMRRDREDPDAWTILLGENPPKTRRASARKWDELANQEQLVVDGQLEAVGRFMQQSTDLFESAIENLRALRATLPEGRRIPLQRLLDEFIQPTKERMHNMLDELEQEHFAPLQEPVPHGQEVDYDYTIVRPTNAEVIANSLAVVTWDGTPPPQFFPQDATVGVPPVPDPSHSSGNMAPDPSRSSGAVAGDEPVPDPSHSSGTIAGHAPVPDASRS